VLFCPTFVNLPFLISTTGATMPTSNRSESPVNEKRNHVNDHTEYHKDGEKGAVDTPANFGVEVDQPWTVTRMIAILSLCIVYVGSQIILYFVSSALLPISISIGSPYGNWMLTANTLGVAAICVGHACS
jgi:hypothetical protein